MMTTNKRTMHKPAKTKTLPNKATLVKLFGQWRAILRSGLIVLAFLYLGKWLQQVSGLPVSGSIFGLILLFTTLSLRLIPLSYLLPTGSVLLNYITLFFVPVGVGLLKYTTLLSNNWLAIVASSVVSTIAVLLVVGGCYQRLSK